MKRAAFTMLELVFAIVVLGILAALAMPRMERDIRQEATDNIIAAIKYTQHLALNDNVTDASSNTWQRKYWRFGKEGCGDEGIFYYIGADKDMQGNLSTANGEVAVDPANGMYMMGLNNKPCENDLSEQTSASSTIFLTKKYGIGEGNMLFSSSCNASGGASAEAVGYIAFDYLGRPHSSITNANTNSWNAPIAVDCNITLSFDDGSAAAVITVEKETGRVYLAQ